jgi:hypothetical protein
MPQTIAINEVMSSNATIIADEDGDFEDWVELYNFSGIAINLEGYGLSDSYANPFKWVFPSITISPGQYLLIWTSGKNRINPEAPLHTNFSISAAGEEIILTDPSGSLIDGMDPTAVPTDFSYGKFPNGTGEWRFFTSPTPAAPNVGPGYGFLLSPLQFSHPDGFYTSEFQLTISSANEGVQIYYTLDGSEPNESSTLYQGPITITSRIGTPNDISMIPTNNNNEPGPPYYEGWQSPLGEVFKINVVRAKAIHTDAPPAKAATYSYLVDSEGHNRYSLPIFSLSTHRNNLFDPEIGIYVHGNGDYPNYFQEGDEWERPANITFFELDGSFGFKEDIGIRLHGNTTRSRPRKSIRVSSRSEYGNSWINYQLFPDKQVNAYKRFILRNSGNDWDWSIFRDAFMQYLAKDLHVGTQYYRPSIVFINGEYWGIHNVRDRYDEHYIYSHYGIEENEMTIMENNSLFKFGNLAGVDHYNYMLNYLTNNNISQSTHYDAIKTMIDIESFIDFQLTHIFVMNTDWPGNNSLYWRYVRDGYDPNAPAGRDGRWRWLILDTDFGFWLPFFYVPGYEVGPAHNTLAFATEENGPSWPNPSWSTLMLRRLLTNQTFKVQFINRYCDLLNTTFSSQHVVSVIDSISGLLEPEMQEHINRWRRPTSMDEWHDNVEVMRSFALQRPSYQHQHIKQKFGLSGEAYVTLNVSNEKYGYIRINSIDIKIGTKGVLQHPYPWTGYYFKGIPIEVEAIPFPGYHFSHWEGASSSANTTLSIDLSTNIELTAHFTRTDEPQLIHFCFFGNNLPNDTPLETIDANYNVVGSGLIEYHSALAGYPFQIGDPNWRKASMERRNSPTIINYIPEGNSGIPFESANMRAIQVKQPFSGDGGENTMIFHAPTQGFEQIFFRFAAKDEGAADNLIVDYSVSSNDPMWITDGLVSSSFPLNIDYQLYEIDFSEIDDANNNPAFKIRIRFDGENMSLDEGNRVTFNNFSINGVALNAYNIYATSGTNGLIAPYGNVGVFEGGDQTFTITPDDGYAIDNVIVNSQGVMDNVSIGENRVGIYVFNNVTGNHTIHATFIPYTHVTTNISIGDIQLFPNPTNGKFKIHFTSKIDRIDLLNIMGNLVYSKRTNSREIEIEMSNLNPGLYIVKISTENGWVVKKLKVEK